MPSSRKDSMIFSAEARYSPLRLFCACVVRFSWAVPRTQTSPETRAPSPDVKGVFLHAPSDFPLLSSSFSRAMRHSDTLGVLRRFMSVRLASARGRHPSDRAVNLGPLVTAFAHRPGWLGVEAGLEGSAFAARARTSGPGVVMTGTALLLGQLRNGRAHTPSRGTHVPHPQARPSLSSHV